MISHLRGQWSAGASLALAGPVALSAEVSPQPLSAVSFTSFLQVILGLGLVLAAIAVTAWALRKLGAGSNLSQSGGVRVVSGVAVGPRERVVVVDVADRRLVLGVAPGRVTRLYDMPRPDEVERSNAADRNGFQEKLLTYLRKRRSDAQ